VSESGTADLALADGSGQENCFQHNVAGAALPADLGEGCSTFGMGDPRVEGDLSQPPHDLLAGMPVAPDYADMDPPGPQPTMPIEIPPATPSAAPTISPSPIPAPSEVP